jgi:hypothetical protein
MKKITIAILLLCGLLMGNAALAHDWFNHWDHNHDGRWDRHEFYAAQGDWGHHHGGYPYSGWGPAFGRYDHDHNHYWDRHEPWRYHHW